MNFIETITEGISVPLTKLAGGYRNQAFIADKVFPVVTHTTDHGKIPVFSSKDAFRIYKTYRSRGARSNRGVLNPDSWVDFSCEEHDLAYPIDQRDIDLLRNLPVDSVASALFNLENRTRVKVQANLALELEKVVADYVQSTANYASGHYTTLSAGTCWSETTSTPITDIETGRDKIRSAIGIPPNTMVMGHDTAKALRFHASYTGLMGSDKTKIVGLDFIKEVHMIKNIYVGGALSIDSDEAFQDMWGDFLMLCYIPENDLPDIDEPAFGYTIRPAFSAKPYPYVDIFTEEGGKIVNVRCTDFYTTAMVMSTCGYLIKNTKK